MKFLKLLLKFILSIFLLLLVVFIFLRFFNTTTKNYRCTGEIKENNSEVFVSLEEYLYSADDSPGRLKIEMPGKHYDIYKLKEVGVFYHLIRLGTDDFLGQMSTLSNTLSLNIKPYGFFEGKCEEIN